MVNPLSVTISHSVEQAGRQMFAILQMVHLSKSSQYTWGLLPETSSPDTSKEGRQIICEYLGNNKGHSISSRSGVHDDPPVKQ